MEKAIEGRRGEEKRNCGKKAKIQLSTIRIITSPSISSCIKRSSFCIFFYKHDIPWLAIQVCFVENKSLTQSLPSSTHIGISQPLLISSRNIFANLPKGFIVFLFFLFNVHVGSLHTYMELSIWSLTVCLFVWFEETILKWSYCIYSLCKEYKDFWWIVTFRVYDEKN